jgi:hypothetical protein
MGRFKAKRQDLDDLEQRLAILEQDRTLASAKVKDIGTAALGGGLEDADHDTKVEVEQSPDEDKIRLTTAGVQRAILDNTALDLTVPVQANTINEHSAAAGVTIDDTLIKDNVIYPDAGTADISFLVSGGDPYLYGDYADEDYIRYDTANDRWYFYIANTEIARITKGAGASGTLRVNSEIKADTINEYTLNSGVTVDTVLIKDGSVDGRDVSTDGTKLDGIATGADVTADNAPKAHHASHVDGSDDIQDATAGQKGLATAAQITKLDGIEAGADQTDATNVAGAGAVMDGDFSASEGFMRKTAAGTYTTHKTNLNANAAPTANDDIESGYSVGSRWIDTTNDKEYVCLDATADHAVWTETTQAGDGGASTFLDLTDTPASYDDQTKKLVRVKDDQTGLEFIDHDTAIEWTDEQTSVQTGSDVVEIYTADEFRAQISTTAVTLNLPLYIAEQAAASDDVAGYGQIWVQNDTPNTLWFTDDAGNDYQLGVGGGASTALDNLDSVAINTSLISDTDSTDDLGSSSIYWANIYGDKLYLRSDATLASGAAGRVDLTGNLKVSGVVTAMGTMPVAGSMFNASGPGGDITNWVGFKFSPAGATANTGSIYGMYGAPTTRVNSGETLGMEGLQFLAYSATVGASGTTGFITGARVAAGALAYTSGTHNVTIGRGIWVQGLQYAQNASAVLNVTDHLMIDAYQNVPSGTATIANLYGLRIDDCSHATTINRILELGPTPYLRLEGSGDYPGAAGDTPLCVAYGVTPTLARVKYEATREVFLDPRSVTTVTALDDWYRYSLSSTGECGFIWKVPADFATLNSVNIVMIPDTTETIQADVDTSVAALGEDYNADPRQSLNLTKDVTINDITEWDIHAADAALFAGVAANDYVAIRFQSDTSNLMVIGCRVSYEAVKAVYLEDV